MRVGEEKDSEEEESPEGDVIGVKWCKVALFLFPIFFSPTREFYSKKKKDDFDCLLSSVPCQVL